MWDQDQGWELGRQHARHRLLLELRQEVHLLHLLEGGGVWGQDQGWRSGRQHVRHRLLLELR